MADISKIEGYNLKDATARSGLSDKMNKANPTGTGAFSLNRKANTTVGSYSVAVGSNCEASGGYSYAEGMDCTANAGYSHAEGRSSTASNSYAHAEGYQTTASGTASHGEGQATVASGYTAHAEGFVTTANHKSQHVFGEYNVADTSTADATARGNYVEIVGNGTGTNARSNARTLDWSGNEVLAGNLKINGDQDVAVKSDLDIENSASGTIATFSDGGDNIPLKSCNVAIVAQQASGTPSPDNPLSITGFSAIKTSVCKNSLIGGIDFANIITAQDSRATIDTTNKTVSYSANGINNKILFTKFKPNTQYTAFCAMSSGVTNLVFKYTDDTTTRINTSGVTVSTSGKTIASLSGSWNTGSSVLYYEQFGLMEGVKVAADFEAYTGTTHTITLPETIYGGTAELVNGNGSKTWIMLNFSDLNFSASNPSSHIFRGDYNGAYKNNIQFSPNPQTATTCITEHYEAMAWQPISGSDDGKFALNDYGTAARFVFIDFNYSTQADFETARNNDKIIVPLVNPIPFTFIGANIPTLSGENNIYSNCGDVEVEYFNENANEVANLVRSIDSDYHIYSTDEHIVGKWIDGKPIYEKTIECGAIPDGASQYVGYKEVAHNISNLNKVIEIKGMAYSDTEFYPLPCTNSGSESLISSDILLYSTKTDIILITRQTWSTVVQNSFVTLRYTKS